MKIKPKRKCLYETGKVPQHLLWLCSRLGERTWFYFVEQLWRVMPGLETKKKNQNKQPKNNPAKPVSHDRVCHLRVTSEKAPCCNLIPWNLLGLHLHTRSEGPGILPKSLGQFHRTDWGSQSTGENLICDKKCTSRGKSRRKCLTPPWTECLYSPDVHPAW